MTDEEQAAFSAFVRARSPALLRTAYLLTGDAMLAEDLLQTALVKTLLAWERIRDRELVDAYVRRVMVNTQVTWWRRRWRLEQPADSLADRPVADGCAEVDERDRLRRVLARLPVRQRTVVVLRYFDDLSEADTAALLGCSVGTVKSQSARALAKLRVALALDGHPWRTPAAVRAGHLRPVAERDDPATATEDSNRGGGRPAVRLTEGELREGLQALGEQVDESPHRLSTEERLRRVLEQCRACEHASQWPGRDGRTWTRPHAGTRPPAGARRPRWPRRRGLLARARERCAVAPVGAVALLVALAAGLAVVQGELRDGHWTVLTPKAAGGADANVMVLDPKRGDSMTTATTARVELPRSASAVSCKLYQEVDGAPCGLLGDWLQPTSDPAILPPGAHLMVALRGKLGWQAPATLGGSVLRRDFAEVFGDGTTAAGFTAVAEGATAVGAAVVRKDGSSSASARWWDVKVTTNPLLTGAFQVPEPVAAPSLTPRYRQPTYLPAGARLAVKGVELAAHGFVVRYTLPGPGRPAA